MKLLELGCREIEIDEIWKLYGKVVKGKRRIEGKTLLDAVTQPDMEEGQFKRAFLMFALNEVLCPTSYYGLSVKLLPAVTVYHRANEYDWCSLVLDHLLYYVRRFAARFHSEGYASCWLWRMHSIFDGQ